MDATELSGQSLAYWQMSTVVDPARQLQLEFSMASRLTVKLACSAQLSQQAASQVGGSLVQAVYLHARPMLVHFSGTGSHGETIGRQRHQR